MLFSKAMGRIIILPIFFAIFSVSFQALGAISGSNIAETWFHAGPISPDIIEKWSNTAGQREYTLQMGDPDSIELRQLTPLRGAKKILAVLDRYPAPDTTQAWQDLVKVQNVQLVLMADSYPTPFEISLINLVAFDRVTLVLNSFPKTEESQLLKQINLPWQITFNAGLYPRYAEDKPGLEELPSDVPVLFIADYWPWYSHMDVLNMLSMPQSLRVVDALPSAAHIDYLRKYKNLKKISVQPEMMIVDRATWNLFQPVLFEYELEWIHTEGVPTAERLKAFVGADLPNARRSFTLDYDGPVSKSELERLNDLDIPVRWIRAATNALQSP